MSKFAGGVLGIVAGMLLCAPVPAEAVMQVGYNFVCYPGSVMGEDQTFCEWVPYYYDDGTGGGYGEPGGDGGAGGGSGGGAGGETAGQPGSLEVAEGLSVTLDGKNVHSDRVSCSDEHDLLRKEVQQAVLNVQPFFPQGATTKLTMGTGEVQTFKRISSTGSFQFIPYSACKRP